MRDTSPADRCTYCGRQIFSRGRAEVIADPDCERSRDHVVPAMMGVKALAPENIVIVCRGCNSIKANHPYEIFDYFRRHAKRQSTGQLRLAMSQFVYSLARVGLIAVMREAAVAAGERYAPPAPPVSRGRFTKRDLRRGK